MADQYQAYSGEIVTRADALASGLKRYFNGTPCRNGHLSQRWSSSAACCACTSSWNKSEAGKAWAKQHRQTEYMKEVQQSGSYKERRRRHDKKRAVDPKRKAWSRNHRFERKYGITLAQYEQMLADQNHRCAICRIEFETVSHRPASPAIDHCHTTGKVRGILCTHCNHGIGKFRDDPALLSSAIEYLARSHIAVAPNPGTTAPTPHSLAFPYPNGVLDVPGVPAGPNFGRSVDAFARTAHAIISDGVVLHRFSPC